MGRDCDFYRKSMNILLRKDYQELRDLVKSCNDLFDVVEGKSGS
jgi:hypothetical protein